MLARTSAAEPAEQGVRMCAVDTGRITDEKPAPRKERMAGVRTPLDIVDGAAREVAGCGRPMRRRTRAASSSSISPSRNPTGPSGALSSCRCG